MQATHRSWHQASTLWGVQVLRPGCHYSKTVFACKSQGHIKLRNSLTKHPKEWHRSAAVCPGWWLIFCFFGAIRTKAIEQEWVRQNASIDSCEMDFFFCWQLLGYVPGGEPFSQLNIGVTDAMAIIKSWWGSSSKTTKTCETRPENHPQKPF